LTELCAVFAQDLGAHVNKPIDNSVSTEELADFRSAREKRRAALSLFIALLILLLLYTYGLREGFFATLFSPVDDSAGMSVQVMTWVAPIVFALVFLAGVLPKYIQWWKVSRRYSWSRQRRIQLEVQLKGASTTDTAVAPVSPLSPTKRFSVGTAFALIFAVVLLGFVAYIFVTPSNTGPVAAITQWISSWTNPTVQSTRVSGAYERHIAAQDTGSGVVITPQTWRYVYFENGTFTTYLQGAQQFSGTWEQAGNQLTIHTPAIAGLSAKYDSVSTVSPDAEYYEFQGNRWNKVH
jgi:hypothetical protein